MLLPSFSMKFPAPEVCYYNPFKTLKDIMRTHVMENFALPCFLTIICVSGLSMNFWEMRKVRPLPLLYFYFACSPFQNSVNHHFVSPRLLICH